MQQNDILNRVLIDIARSLLQYTGQAWPWTGSNSRGERAKLEALNAEQCERIERLSELLLERGWTIDFGVFPDYSDLHYLAFDFVLSHLIENERAIVRSIEAAVRECASDPEASAALSQILAGEQNALAQLEAIEKAQPAGHASYYREH